MLERKGRPILGRLEAMLGTQRIKVIEENVHLPPTSTPTLTTPRLCSALFCGPSVKGGKTERFDWEGKGRGGVGEASKPSSSAIKPTAVQLNASRRWGRMEVGGKSEPRALRQTRALD